MPVAVSWRVKKVFLTRDFVMVIEKTNKHGGVCAETEAMQSKNVELSAISASCC